MSQENLPTSATGTTPVRRHKLQTKLCRSGPVTLARKLVMEHIGPSIDVISVETFQKNLLPSVPVDVGDVLNTLLNKRSLVAEGFQAMLKDSASQAAREPTYFAPIKDIHGQIVDAALSLTRPPNLLRPILEYRVCGDMKPISDRKSTSRPDGYQILVQDHEIHSAGPNANLTEDNWLDIPRCDEYKKGNSKDDLFDNIEKVCWSAHHIMRNDARRRFTFGLTIEKTDARMWFFNRQVALVSQSFDYMKNPRHFIHLVLSLSFASPTDLGYDPSMRLYKDGTEEHCRYEIDFEGTTYRVVESLSDFQADFLRGRATRVFKAARVAQGKVIGQLIVIKDIWMDDDRENEGKILENLLHDLPEKFHRYFLTVIRHGNVKVNGKDDNTSVIHLRGLDIDATRVGYLETLRDDVGLSKPDVQGSRGVPPEADLANPPPPSYIYYPKNHYRIILKEICKPLEEVRDWPTVFRALKETVEIIIAMYNNSRWVHRDLSTGNILLDLETGQVKLGDLEFAQKINSGTPHAMRTGTVEFMSVEVQDLYYAFLPGRRTRTKDSAMPNSVFVHNSLHDLESIWWIFMRFLFRFVPKGEYDSDALLNQLFQSKMVFPDPEFQVRRSLIFTSDQLFERLRNDLVNKFCADELFAFADNFRWELINAYREAESILPTSGVVSYDGFPEAFRRIRELFQEGIRGLDSCPELVHLQTEWGNSRRAAIEKRPAPADAPVENEDDRRTEPKRPRNN